MGSCKKLSNHVILLRSKSHIDFCLARVVLMHNFYNTSRTHFTVSLPIPLQDKLPITGFPRRSSTVVLPVISNVSSVSNSQLEDIGVKALFG